MKGAVFTILEDMVLDRFGLDTWDAMLEHAKPASEGVYTAGDTYSDGELFSLVGALSQLTGAPVPDLVRAFGEYTLHQFASLYPAMFEDVDARGLLRQVDDVIHVEVRKLYPDAALPTFDYVDTGADRLVMLYRSPRRLCTFAEGLIEGTARHYGVDIATAHPRCMHHGDDHCRLELTFA